MRRDLWITGGRARRLWTPRALGLHALLLAALVACAWLGQWQFTRYAAQQRGPVLERPEPPVPVQSLLQPSTTFPAAAPGRAVTARGRFTSRGQLLLPDRLAAGGRRGFWLLAPLQVDGGATLAVVRGWVPTTHDAAVSVPSGEVTVSGRLQPAEPVDPAEDESLPTGQANAASAVELLDDAPGPFYPGLLVAQSVSPETAAAPAPVELWVHSGGGTAGLRNLAYALQWWLFAGFAVFLWWRALALTEPEPDVPATPASPVENTLERTP